MFNSSSQTVQAALAGFGLAFVPEGAVEADLANARLVRVLEDWCPWSSGYHLYDRSRREASPAFALLVDALRYRGDRRGVTGRRGSQQLVRGDRQLADALSRRMAGCAGAPRSLYSTFRPELFTTAAHFSSSESTNFANSCGELPTTSAPSAVRRSLILGVLKMPTMSRFT